MARDKLCCLPFLANAHPTGWLVHFQSFMICRIRYITMFGCMAASFQHQTRPVTLFVYRSSQFSAVYICIILYLLLESISKYIYIILANIATATPVCHTVRCDAGYCLAIWFRICLGCHRPVTGLPDVTGH